MTERPPQPHPDAALLPILAAVTYLAGVIGLWGVVSLVLDRDVIDYADAGPLLGPIMAAGASVVTWLVSWRSRSWVAVPVALVASFGALVLLGTFGYTLIRADLSWLVGASVHFAISPFMLGAGALSAAIVAAVLRIRSAGSRPI